MTLAAVKPARTEEQKSRSLAYLTATLVSLIAAGTFLVANRTTAVFAPLELGWFRISISFVLIYVIAGYRGALIRPRREDLPALIAMGLLGITANQLLFLSGIQLAPPLDGAMIYAFTPVAVLLVGRVTLGEQLTWKRVGGISCAILGVSLVLRARGLQMGTANLMGDGLLMLAMLSWAAYTLIGKRLMASHGALGINTWAFGIGALSVLPLAPSVLLDFDWAGPGPAGWLGLGYLSLITSVVSFTLWTFALKSLEATEVAVFTNLQPALTALLSWIFLSQVPSPMVLGGLVLVIAGVWLTQARPKATG